MSDTPRTDEAVRQLLQTSQHERVSAEFARKLEREVTRLFARKLEREVARLHQEIRDLQELKRDALKDINRITQLEVKLETEQQNVRTLQKLSESMWLMLTHLHRHCCRMNHLVHYRHPLTPCPLDPQQTTD